MEYVNVGNIIEQERLKRQAQIYKGVDTTIIDYIEKAHDLDIQKDGFDDMPDNLKRFANDVESLNKGETEFLLTKIQGELNANFGNALLKSMKTIALQHLNSEIEKARSGVYADTAENRKLGRVGQKYGNEKKEDKQPTKGTKSKDSKSKFNSSISIDNSAKTLANKFFKYANGEDDSMEFLNTYKQLLDANADVKQIYKKSEKILHDKLYDVLGGESAVQENLKEFKAELNNLHRYTGNSKHKNTL